MEQPATAHLGTTSRTASLLDALERAWGRGEVDALDGVLASSFVRHGRSSQQSREELKASIVDMRRAFPDLTMTVERVVEGSDEVALYWTSNGTLTDTYLGLPATGRTYSVSGATFSTFDGDTVVEESVIYDRRGKYSSLGVPLSGSGADEVAVDSAAGPDAVRAMHRTMITGVTVVSTDSNGEPRGLAVNAFSSVSLEPPLILICVQKNSSTYSHLIASKYFGVSVLAADQMGVARVFATKQERKFDHVEWHRGELGVPLLDGATSTMEVELQDTLHASTHTIFIGRIKAVAGSNSAPLIYTNGQFFDGGQLVAAEDLAS
ncbi:flavin reductase [Aeromicrobium fastidiosum]|uniref:flavin reductase n=1 Tax=Aeromicrobium TaxID=2040 RepID=UPI00177C7656|nr:MULTISPECIES: flavin reductase [Aeromicrobium]MBD8605502.1 flavin reductase [Aeromicrobium sp. CFBP 8757]MCL8250419.1 flavin reductase [Aeromicrobium fastidiosum]